MYTVLTLWLWKFATTLSAPCLSAKAISAVTVGYVDTTLQLTIAPPTGSSADWISAAVVPGAKLLPITTNGPEPAPLIEIPMPLLRTVACPFSG